MTESEEVSGRKRRSSAEIKRLVTEFQTSGLRQNEFCRNHGLALSSLQRQLKKRRRDQGEVKESGGLVAVYWFDLGAAGFFAAVAAGFCLYAAMLVHAVSGVKTPNAALATS